MGDWAKPGHAGTIFAPHAAAVALHGPKWCRPRVRRGRSWLHLHPARAATSFQRRALEVRLLVSYKHGLGRGTPVPLQGRQLLRLHYTVLTGSTPSPIARSAPASRACPTFSLRALSERLFVRRAAGPRPVTPALSSRRMLLRLHFTAENGVAHVGRGRSRLCQGRPYFFATRFKLAPCYAEGGRVKPSHAGAILAPNAASVVLQG